MSGQHARHWVRKFACAGRGVLRGMLGQSSFVVHLSMTCFVVALAAWLRLAAVEWCILLVCITLVLSAELFNSAIESLARAITHDHNPNLADGLDMAAGAVLLAAVGSSLIGLIVLGRPLLRIVLSVM